MGEYVWGGGGWYGVGEQLSCLTLPSRLKSCRENRLRAFGYGKEIAELA